MKTIFKDKNITHLKNFIFLSDGTPVVLYTKFDYEQNFVLIDDQEFGPFESADIYANIYGIFDKSAQTEDFSDISEPEVFETEDPWIRKDGDFVYFETGKKSFGPFKAIWEYQILDSEHFQFLCILPVDDYALHYVINGKYITDIPLKKALSQTNTKYIPYFAPYCHLNYSESGKALLYDLPDNCMYIDGKKTDFF